MRYLLSVSLLGLAASGALAGEFNLDSAVSTVTIYPQGATITRNMAFDIPGGRHTLMITDIPYQFKSETLQILGGEGLVFGASRIISSRVQPNEAIAGQRQALELEIETLEAKLVAAQEEAAGAGLIINAASARIKLLESIGGQQAQGAASALESQNISVETLTALVSLVGSETLTALEDAQAGRERVAEINREAEVFRKRLLEAKEELARLVEPSEWYYGLALDVEASAETAGTLQISYVVEEASWRPVYDMALNTNSESLRVVRKVMIGQYTGETWQDAALTVSTSAPFDWQEFQLPYTNLARFEPPIVALELDMRRATAQMGAGAALLAPMAVMEEPAAMAGANLNFQGITATYSLPPGTIIATNDEGTLVTLNSTDFDVDLSARANMSAGGDTAFLIATLTNSSAEPFLPGEVSYFRDGAFVRASNIGMVAAGASSELGFGRLDGVTVKRRVLRREDGSSGVLTTSNDRIEDYAFNIENLTNRAWDIVVYDRVPVSEQEQLVIDWSARPRPTETDVEGRRGVLAWEFGLESGEMAEIKLSYELQWPEGNELRLGQ